MYKKVIFLVLILVIPFIGCEMAELNEGESTPTPWPYGTPGPSIPPIQVEGAVIIDHTCTDVSQIPNEWISEVKKMMISIPGESHSRGYVYGLELLELENPIFAAHSTWTGEPEGYTDQHLRITRTYRNGGAWSSSASEASFWTNETGRNNIKNHLDYMRDTLNNPLHAFGFGWCWDMLWQNPPTAIKDPVYGVGWAGTSVGGPDGDLPWGLDSGDTIITGNSVNLQTYIDAVVEYNAHAPETATIFTTGPRDGYAYNEAGYQAFLKNEAMRHYVRENGGILFDYTDILCWNDNGEQNMEGSWNGHTFPYVHEDNRGDYTGDDLGLDGSGACHVGRNGCLRLGKAMWWMMARIAGWLGP